MILALSILLLDPSFLTRLAQVESSNRPGAIGDGGRAHGIYQMHAAAWADVSAARAKRGAQVYPFSFAHDQRVSREYAAEYLAILRKNFTATQGRQPTSGELYALWNLGPRGFQRRGFSIDRAPKTTQRAAAQFK